MRNIAYTLIGAIGLLLVKDDPSKPLGPLLVSGSVFGLVNQATKE